MNILKKKQKIILNLTLKSYFKRNLKVQKSYFYIKKNRKKKINIFKRKKLLNP